MGRFYYYPYMFLVPNEPWDRKVKETISLSEGRSSDMSDLMIHVQETQMQAKVEHCHRV